MGNTKTPAPSKPSNNTKTPAPSKPVSTPAPKEADGLIPELKVYSKDKLDAAAFTKDLAEAVTKASKKNVSSDRFEPSGTKQVPSKLKNYKLEVTLKLSVKPAKDEKDVGTPSEIVKDINSLAEAKNGTILGNGAFMLKGDETEPPTHAPTKKPDNSTHAPTKKPNNST